MSFSLLTLCLPFYFLLSDSSALDTQVFSHYSHQPCAFVILLHVHVFVHMFVLCLVMWGFVEFVTPLTLKTTLLWTPLFPNCSPTCRCECSMCLRAILLSLCDACPFITIVFQRMICVSNWVFWSARKECYTIDKSGPKHQERQNSQSWAHKLHWGGIILYFAWGTPLFLLCFIYLSLNWPLNVLDLKNFSYIYFIFYLYVLWLDSSPAPSPALYLCFLSLQPRSILDPKVLGLQAGGWVAFFFTAKTFFHYAFVLLYPASRHINIHKCMQSVLAILKKSWKIKKKKKVIIFSLQCTTVDT